MKRRGKNLPHSGKNISHKAHTKEPTKICQKLHVIFGSQKTAHFFKKILSEVPIRMYTTKPKRKVSSFFDISENSHNFFLKLRSILQDKNVH